MPPTNSPQSPRRSTTPPALAESIAAAVTTVDGTAAAPSSHDVPRPLTPLSYLSSPVTDLASTLRTYPHDERLAAAAGDPPTVRAPTMPEEQNGSNPSHSFASRLFATDREHHERRQRVHRVMVNMSRSASSANPSGLAAPSSTSAYGNRTPSPGRQDLYDWAPSASQRDANVEFDQQLDRLIAETSADYLENMAAGATLRRQRLRNASSGEGASTDGSNGVTGRREERVRDHPGPSLRSRALLQRHREQTQNALAGLAGRDTGSWAVLRAAMEYRERSNMSEEEERAREQGWIREVLANANAAEPPRSATPSSSSRDSWPLPPPSAESHSQSSRENDIHRRLTAETISRHSRLPVTSATVRSMSGAPPSAFLENSLKYINELRTCYSYEEALGAAIDHGMATKEFFADKHDDFVMDLEEIDSLADSSWLQPGTVFSGHQHGASQQLPTRAGTSSLAVEQINPNFRASPTLTFDHPPGSTRTAPYSNAVSQSLISQQFPSLDAGRLPPSAKPSHHPSHDQWPVRVIIHSVDYEKMLVQGTMEAYDVPQHGGLGSLGTTALNASTSSRGDDHNDRQSKAGRRSAPIRTYLEGHIIDLRTHSFVTPSSGTASKTGSETSAGHSTHTSGCPSLTLNKDIPFPAASPAADAANWRRLPPFSTAASSLHAPISSGSSSAQSTDDAVARLFLSKSQLRRIHREYIFMRWKERCFVHDDPPAPPGSSPSVTPTTLPATSSTGPDASRPRTATPTSPSPAREKCPGLHVHGLTISGFYYISLRRSDGRIEGLYFDPNTTPHQHLQLDAVNGGRMGWASCELR